MLDLRQTQDLSQLFKGLGDPFRICLLLTLEQGEACVCHLECLLGKRQAYISQQLMTLRQAGLIKARRDGRFVYYSLSNPTLIGAIRTVAESMGVLIDARSVPATITGEATCACPQCGISNLVPIVD
ncbi:MAG: metalloregulator ArsR/SmtB family transcription factor [Anaerolineales bacterium]